MNGGGSNSENTSDQRRALMLPQELKELPEAEQIIICENTRPIRCEKARYYSEAVFMDRLKALSPALSAIKGLPDRAQFENAAFVKRELAMPVPVLDIDTHLARVQQRLRPLTLDDGIDLKTLDLDLSKIPALDNPVNPTEEDLNRMLDGAFEAMDVDTQAVMADRGDSPEAIARA